MDKKQNTIIVAKGDLPLYCPRPQDNLYASHPRVYLPIEEKKELRCPYCGQRYRLED